MNDLTHAIPPQNVEAEESILGGILLDPEAMGRVSDILTPEAFYNSIHRRIYTAAQSLHRAGQPTDLMTVMTWLQDKGGLEAIGGTGTLAQLVDRTVSAVNIDRYAALVLEKHQRRQLIGASYTLAELGYDTTQELSEVFDKAEQSVFAVTQSNAQGGLVSASVAAVEFFAEFEALTSGEKSPGVPSGFYDLDAMTGGFAPSDLIILAARPSLGKTSLAINIAQNIARQGKPVAVFSLEMSRGQLFQRMVAAETGIASTRLRSGQVSPAETDRIVSAIGELGDIPMSINDAPTITVGQIRSDCRRLMAERGQLGMVVIDYLQLMGESSDNRVQELSRISRGLKALARELECPVMALSQLSRGVESRTNKRPVMSDLRDSGAIEQDADIVAMLYRDEYYNPESHDRGVAELIITKHRNGPTGTVRLLFDSQLTKFANLAQ